tara:strand:+ start:362 stop:1591 length:1230 start_codon:yes stop_codon:yes gene_type:complete
MNILFLEMEHQNLQFMKKLVESGHNVYTNQYDSPNYLKSFGITALEEIPYMIWATDLVDIKDYEKYHNNLPEIIYDRFEQVLEKYKIDLVINTYPIANEMIHSKDWGVDIVTCSPEAVKLETEKMFANKFARHCGIKCPNILQTGNDNHNINAEKLPDEYVIKPMIDWVSSTMMRKEYHDKVKELYGGFSKSYYLEEVIKGLETNISYIMSDGEWAFTFSEHCDESKAKQVWNVNPQVWYANTTIEELEPDIDKKVRDNVVEYLNQTAKLGGTYEGSITQMLGEDGELYFLENNCRPYVNNTFPIPYTGDEYLDAFRNNPKKIGDWFEGRKFPKIVLQSPKIGKGDEKCVYPFHLHTKYNIAEPTPIEIIDDKYIATKGGVVVVFEDEINMDFIEEVEKESELRAYFGN